MVQVFVSLNQNKTQTCHPKNFEAKDRVAASEIFCWVSTRICVWTCLDECILGVSFVDVVFLFFDSLIRYVLFENSFLKWCDWAPFLENRWKWSNLSTFWSIYSMKTSRRHCKLHSLRNKRNVKQIRDATNVFFFVVLSTSFGVLPGVRPIFSFAWRSFVWDIFATRAWTPEKSISQEAHMEVGSTQALTTI